MICNSTTTKTSKHHSCSLNHKHTGNLISFLTWLSATRKLQSISTSAKIFQIHLPTLTQIVTQVCAKACGRSGQIAVKFRIFCWRNGRILRKNAKYHKPIAAGSHEVSGSIPLISTRKVLKSHDFRTFSLLSSANNQPHFCSHATWPRFDPNGRENAVDLSRFIWQNSTSFSVFKNILNVWTAAATCSRRFGFGVRSRCGWCFRSRLPRSVSCLTSSERKCWA